MVILRQAWVAREKKSGVVRVIEIDYILSTEKKGRREKFIQAWNPGSAPDGELVRRIDDFDLIRKLDVPEIENVVRMPWEISAIAESHD